MNKFKNKLNLGMIFGSRSVEHEVSIITAQQVINAADQNKYNVVPIYIDKKGDWFTGEKLNKLESFKDLNMVAKGLKRASISPSPFHQYSVDFFLGMKKGISLDVVFPLVHGTFGEDGTLQGLLELSDMPYVGAGVLASAIGMDKEFTKKVLTAHQLPVTKYIAFSRKEYAKNKAVILENIKNNLHFPLFVKPSNLGSSIGISKAISDDQLKYAIEVASEFDSRLLVEEGINELIEVNCSVLGGAEKFKTSVCECPVSGEELLSYDDKYCSGSKNMGMKGTRRIIPAPISDTLTSEIQKMAIDAFQAINGYGIARVDFLINKKDERVYVNEINTLPGSLSFYLWEAGGMTFSELIDELVELAIERHEERKQTVYSYNSNILNRDFGLKNN